MRALFRLVGTLLIFAAIAGFGLELSNALESGHYAFIPLGEVWADLHANSLVGLQAAIEQGSPGLWQDVVLPILFWPVWAAPLGLGLILRLIGRRTRPRTTASGRAQIQRLVGLLQNTDIAALRRQLRAKAAASTPKSARAATPSQPSTKQGGAPNVAAKARPSGGSPVSRPGSHQTATGPQARRSGPTVVRGS